MKIAFGLLVVSTTALGYLLLYRFLQLVEKRLPLDTYVCCGSVVIDGHPICPMHGGYVVYGDEPQSENEFQDEVDS